MVETPDIALAASAREWPDRFHRFVLDHGGARVVDRVMSHDQALSSSFDVLLIDDVSSFLTVSLVQKVRARGSQVIGVFSPDDGADAKQRLLDCGIVDMVESDATPQEMIRLASSMFTSGTQETVVESGSIHGLAVGVTGATAGIGITEMAMAVALAASSSAETVLVDLDPSWPSIAQRLDLGVHPNVRTCLDYALHRPDEVEASYQSVRGLSVVVGETGGTSAGGLARPDAVLVLDAVANSADVLVADLGPHRQIPPGVLREFSGLIVVCNPEPVSVLRTISTVAEIRSGQPHTPILVAINRCRRGFQLSEVVSELESALGQVHIVAIPFDRSIGDAAWDGTTRSGREFRKAMDAVAAVVTGGASRGS